MLSIIGKIYTDVLVRRLSPCAESNNILADEQAGTQRYQETDVAFRAGLIEASNRAEDRYRLLLWRCHGLEDERDALLTEVAKLKEAVSLLAAGSKPC